MARIGPLGPTRQRADRSDLLRSTDSHVVKGLTTVVAVLLTGACAAGSTVPAPPPTPAVAATAPGGSASEASSPSVASTPRQETLPTCDGSVVFDDPPVDLDAVELLVPFGLVSGSHVTPVDHQYFQNFLEPDRAIDVYSPGAGRVVSIQHFGAPISENSEGLVDDFRLVIEHTCTISSIFIHIDELIPRLAVNDPGIGNYAEVDVEVAAGELIGTFTENVDYNVVDLDFIVNGLIDPNSYQQEPWKIHVPDTFDYFAPDIRKRLEALSLRTAEPRAGRFAYDIDGQLSGNWFLEGTNGYGGATPDRYWAGHLSFAYNHLDPSTVVVSIGTFDGRSRQFAVLGNAPDPAEVSADSGLVVYDLVDWDYFSAGERWDRRSHATGIEAIPGDVVHGVIAVQLIGDRTLLVEVFPGSTSADISALGPNASTYTR